MDCGGVVRWVGVWGEYAWGWGGVAYEDPDAVVFCCEHEAVPDGVVRLFVQDSVALDSIDRQLAFGFGEQPLSCSCGGMGKVWEQEDGDQAQEEAGGSFDDEEPLLAGEASVGLY